MPDRAEQPRVLIAPVGTRPEDEALWLDAGTVDEFARTYPAAATKVRHAIPSRNRGWVARAALDPDVQVDYIVLAPPTSRPNTTYVLACRSCRPRRPLPFPSATARNEWASQHTTGTGHADWDFADLTADV